jgi:diazepam-binding inhibitor (GABA receptor modulating acyl-CoA-binding protein)
MKCQFQLILEKDLEKWCSTINMSRTSDDPFVQAQYDLEDFLPKLSNNDKLILYGLYKQATVGDVNTSRPGFFDAVGKAKWDAWKAKEGLSSENAKQAYIDISKEFIQKYE